MINIKENEKLNELKGREENILTLLRKAIWSEKIDEYNEKSIGRKGR